VLGSHILALIDFERSREREKEKPPDGPNAYYTAIEDIVLPAIKQTLMYAN
jgi:hypothetical protein